MAFKAIVTIAGKHYRPYAIEPDDQLIVICLRAGRKDWRAIYDDPVNAAFKTRYPDPDDIDFVNPVDLLVPLPGSAITGVSKRGKPLADYMIARITDQAGAPLPGIEVRVIKPGGPHGGDPMKTSADGDVIIESPAAGDWKLASAAFELMPKSAGAADYPPQSLASLGTPPDPGNHFTLTRNGIDEVVARKAHFIVCPMCAVTFRVILKATASASNPTPSDNICPNDNFNLSTLQADIEAAPTSFTSPATGQDLQAVAAVKARGTRPSIATRHGTVTVYWDESRFLKANGGNYTLFGLVDGVAKSIMITGRATWGAGPVKFGGGRLWAFNGVAKRKDPPYDSFGISSNETTPLGIGTVLRWMTIHHTTNDATGTFATATALQTLHQDEGIEDDGPAADIGYHFVIDSNGAIYEGRPLGIKGSHTGDFNSGNVGIVLAGDFESRIQNLFMPDTPTASARASLTLLVDVLAARFKITSVWSHQERNKQATGTHTECPGDNLIGQVNGIMRLRFPGPPP